MKRILPLIFLAVTFALSAQPCSNGRYQDSVFAAVNVSTVTYSSVNNLLMDIYQPTGDTFAARPLIVLAHGGSFISGTRTDDNTIVSLCQNFAKRGYVTASIDYREGNAISMVTDSSYALARIFGAISDAKAAVRYFYKDALTTNTYKIDTNNIVIGGNSAGAVMALHYAYIDNEAECPAYIQTIMDTSGGIDGNSGNAGYSSKVKAVINLAGGLTEPGFINAGSKPVFSAQGDQDNTVPYTCAYLESGTVMLRICGLGSLQALINANTTGSSSIVFPGEAHVPWQSNANEFHVIDSSIAAFLVYQVCSNTPCTPAISITSSAPDTICGGEFVTFTATVTNGGTNPSLQWYNGGSMQQNGGFTWTTNQLGQGNLIRCILTSNAACANLTPVNSNVINTYIKPTPIMNISANNAGDSLIATQTYFTIPLTGFQWYLNGTAINGATGSEYGPLQYDSVYTVMATNAVGCTSSLSSPYTYDSISLIPCSGMSQQLCLVTSDSNNTENIIVWEKANKFATDSFFVYRSDDNITYQQIAAIGRDSLSVYEDASAHPDQMSYRYKINVKDTCGNYQALSFYHQTIYLHGNGGGNFQWVPYVIENSVTPVATYEVYRDDSSTGNWNLLASVSNVQTAYTDPDFALYPLGRYKVVVMLVDYCNPTRSFSSITSNIMTHAQALGIKNVSADNVILVPNPAHDRFEVVNSNAQHNIKSLVLLDQLGNRILVPYSISGLGRINADISSLAAGLYYVMLNYRNEVVTTKIVKY